MNTIDGNLISLAKQKKFDVIIHGCNCFNTMGAGIALSIKNEFPEAYKTDLKTIKGSRDKLGNYSSVLIEEYELTVVNAYTQYHWDARKKPCDYNAIRNVFKKIKKDFSGKRIGLPKIGAGLAGGDWNKISKIINEELCGENYTLVIFKLSG